MSNPTVHLTGTLDNIVAPAPGTAVTVAGAKVRVELSNYGPYIPASVGVTRSTLAKGTEYAAIPSPGTFEAWLFRNDLIYPIGTFYTVIVEDADGNIIQCGAYRFNADGDFDLATQTPIDGQDPPPALPPTPPYGELLVITPGTPTPNFPGDVYTAWGFKLTEDATGPTVSNLVQGNLYTFIISQDATGGWKFTWPTAVLNGTEINPTPSELTIQTFVAIANGNGPLLPVAPGTYYP